MSVAGYLSRLPQSGLVVFLTGAGVSAESGIPTFRGPEGYWTVGAREYHPSQLATHHAFTQIPEEVWSWYLYRRTVCNQAEPNPGHQALVRLEQALGDRFRLITQNVDGLHLRAGNSLARTYQVHGNIDYLRCSEECSPQVTPIGDRVGPKSKGSGLTSEEAQALVCPRCGCRARPHVLWFDESYDEEHFFLHSAMNCAFKLRLLVTAGSSGATTLPMRIASVAAQTGALMIDINPEANPFAQLALQAGGQWLKTSASEGLAEIEAALVR